MSWSNQEDFQKDLYAFSENQVSPNSEPEPLPVSIAQWNALNRHNREQSIYDSLPYENDVIIISSGRGRGRRSELYRPGATFDYGSTSEDEEIRRRLQEVNSQSYANVNIETTIKMRNNTPINDQFCDAKESIIHNALSSTGNLKSPINGSCSSSSSPPILAERIEEKPPILPLSQMRQIARQKLYSQVLKDKNDLKE